jgi:hypothetical protein
MSFRRISRRAVLGGALGAATASIWVPNKALAQTSGRGAVKHLIYIRLAGGFRFTTAFNAGVDGQFNPFGESDLKPAGTEWGVSRLLDGSTTWLDGQANQARVDLGMKKLSALANQIAVLPCVDHEPFSARADGNHGTGLERFFTGYVGGATSFLSFLNYGLRAQVAAADAAGKTLLPAFSLGESGMATGAGIYAAFRPPVLDGEGFERFGTSPEAGLPAWAFKMANAVDERMKGRLHTALAPTVEAYQQTRAAARSYGKIFQDELLRISERSTTVVDGISNRELDTIFGASRDGRRAALALRLFHFGSPAVFLNQGGYDMHSAEEANLPMAMDAANRVISGLIFALQKMTHPAGGTYWDHTLVVLGSEFGRTTGGSRFNSAGGSDHSSDLATRWMSMPMLGGVVNAAGKGGRSLGQTRPADLRAEGQVYSYRAMLKTLLDLLGADHANIFPADRPIEDLFV